MARLLLLAALAVAAVLPAEAVPLEKPGRINDLPGYGFFQPEKIPQVPVLIGERSEPGLILLYFARLHTFD